MTTLINCQYSSYWYSY